MSDWGGVMTFEDFVQAIGVMKPNHVREDNPNQIKRLEEILHSNNYVAENKVDGCHYFGVGPRFISIDKKEKTDNFPHLHQFFINLGMPNMILDGEINYPNKTSQFCTRVTGGLANTAIKNQQKYGPIHYTLWDILRTPKGTWLVDKPLRERRKILEQFYDSCVRGTKAEEWIHLTDFVLENKKRFYEQEIAAGREGIVLKNLDSLYVMGKRPMWQWMKMKQTDMVDLFISGFEPAAVKYTGTSLADWPYWMEIRGVSVPVTKFHYMGWIGAIELSAFVDGNATKICTCSGIDEDLRRKMSENPENYLNRVVRVGFMEKTEAGYPRHPKFDSFHETKQAKECTYNFD